MDISWPEILIIAVVVLILFGSRKMPDAARSLGRSLRILKTEVKGLHDDEPAADPPPAAGQLPPAPTRQATPEAPVTSAGDRSDTA